MKWKGHLLRLDSVKQVYFLEAANKRLGLKVKCDVESFKGRKGSIGICSTPLRADVLYIVFVAEDLKTTFLRQYNASQTTFNYIVHGMYPSIQNNHKQVKPLLLSTKVSSRDLYFLGGKSLTKVVEKIPTGFYLLDKEGKPKRCVLSYEVPTLRPFYPWEYLQVN